LGNEIGPHLFTGNWKARHGPGRRNHIRDSQGQ
jgi:hypothetical protein